MEPKRLSLRGVSHAIGALPVLRSVSLEVWADEFVGVVGPSGCGKTTLLSLMGGFFSPTEGELRRFGVTRMVYQHDSLFPWLTVAENIDVGIGRGTDDNERAAQISSMLTLARLEEFAHHYPHQLSGGMRRRAELARVLAGPADVLLLDEPFASLDYQTRRRMHGELVRMLSEEPRAVVLVTHDVEEAALLADRIIVFSESPGRVCAEFRVDLPRERNTTEPAVLRAVEGIVSKLAL